MEYLDGPRDSECFFCAVIAAGEDQDENNLVLARGESAFIILNKFPYNTGHLLVAPYEHRGDIQDLEARIQNEIMALVTSCVHALKTAMKPQAFNLGANMGEVAGAGVPGHFHFHVVPRWGGDTNFMPVVGGAKVLPETLIETFARVKPEFAS